MTIRRTVALGAASVLTLWSAAPALAGPGHGNGHGNGNSAHGQQHHQDKGGQNKGGNSGTHGNSGNAPGHSGSHGNSGNAPGHSGTHGNSGNAPGHTGSQGNGHAGGNGDPAGNNGTVKIAPLGEMDSIPNNTPHVGCSFEIEWYGFDEGDDVVSTVSFTAQAPTSDAGITVDGPSQVFVGADPATGAGTATGLDGRETYTLSFTGEPHPKQGYHVRLTVHTPRSQGNDTKTKVFWVAPCESDTGGGGDTGDTGDTGGTGTTGGGSAGTGDTEVLGEQASSSDQDSSSDTEVLGEQATAPGQSSDSDAVPTAVDAGEDGSAVSDFVRSPWPLAIAALGALLTVTAAAGRRRRSGARAETSE